MIVSLSKLRQLVTVARFASLTRAADELRVSQPALSRNVAFVEDVYGVKIFDRTPQGVVATAAGSVIIAEATRLLRSAETFDHNAGLIGSARLGYVSFGMGPIVANILMAKVAIALIEDGKHISFRAQVRRLDYLTRALVHGELEVGIAGDVSLPMPEEIEQRTLGAMRLAAIARSGHPLAGQPNVGLDSLRHYPVASPMDLNQLRSFHPIPHHIACDDYAAMKEMAAATDTVCLCASIFARTASQSGEVVTLDVGFPEEQREIEVVALTLKGRTASPAVELIIDACREVLAAAE